MVQAYADAAAALGVCILEHTEVMDVAASGGNISSVTTNRGTITTDAVICCAGAWSQRVGDMVNVNLPVVPVRRQIGMTRQMSSPLPTVPFTLDLSTTMYFHNYRNGMLLGISNSNQEPGFARDFTHGWLPEFNAAARVCAPALEAPELECGWAGLYENTPDHNALIGASGSVGGFYYATGFSGHGFLQGTGRRRTRPGPLPGPGILHGSHLLLRRSFPHGRSAHSRSAHHLARNATAPHPPL